MNIHKVLIKPPLTYTYVDNILVLFESPLNNFINYSKEYVFDIPRIAVPNQFNDLVNKKPIRIYMDFKTKMESGFC